MSLLRDRKPRQIAPDKLANDRLRTPSLDPPVSAGLGCNASRVLVYVTCSCVCDTVLVLRIGCGSVSTRDQNPDGQRDALAASGCDEILVDKAIAVRSNLSTAHKPKPASDKQREEFAVI